jgi:hypothetical protein
VINNNSWQHAKLLLTSIITVKRLCLSSSSFNKAYRLPPSPLWDVEARRNPKGVSILAIPELLDPSHICKLPLVWNQSHSSDTNKSFVKATFYVTDNSKYRNRTFYFRKDVWHDLSRTAIEQLISVHFSPFDQVGRCSGYRRRNFIMLTLGHQCLVPDDLGKSEVRLCKLAIAA